MILFDIKGMNCTEWNVEMMLEAIEGEKHNILTFNEVLELGIVIVMVRHARPKVDKKNAIGVVKGMNCWTEWNARIHLLEAIEGEKDEILTLNEVLELGIVVVMVRHARWNGKYN
jgi:hypothetical protein